MAQGFTSIQYLLRQLAWYFVQECVENYLISNTFPQKIYMKRVIRQANQYPRDKFSLSTMGWGIEI